MNPHLLLAIPVLPLLGAILAGLFGKVIGRAGAHTVTIAAVAVSCVLSISVWRDLVWGGAAVFNGPVYTWLVSDGIHFQVGFLIDRLSALMMVVVTFVSLCVHVYTIGYMADDSGYQRFFAYISLFTFSMLMLVMSNNFMQLFFGWEAVGVVSYLLIGFWYTRPSAIFANFKAFIVNRVGDFGFVLGIAGIAYYTGSLDYQDAFAAAPHIAAQSLQLTSGTAVPAMTLICICLFVGAMGKSAQVPLHVWLPDSMEGPTPISALIHAATMVTAGIFMVARMSPLFENAWAIQDLAAGLGAATLLMAGLIALVQTDIKRVIAYSTMSQIGYMFVGAGIGAYPAAMFHLMTHAFFKALLFLAAGIVIHAVAGEQDIRKLAGVGKLMPFSRAVFVAGSLALVGIFPFAGFFSKDAILAACLDHGWYGDVLYAAGLAGALLTGIYAFRLFFIVFFGEPSAFAREHFHRHHGQEGPFWMLVPVGVLAVLSTVGGFIQWAPLWTPFTTWLDPVARPIVEASNAQEWATSAVAMLVGLTGIGIAWAIYGAKRVAAPKPL
ncbi:MAG TPA: NADH-quinone oxidoreductase subunit L, partial [Steroidobacteraceae bacterium]|nr:NADH-quinone oxidoreductase subunit L [Steroidobacteraceae bacterium]